VVSANDHQPFPDFFTSRKICENNSSKLWQSAMFLHYRIKKEKINIKSEEPLKNLKTSSGSSPALCLSNHPKMDPKYLVRQSL
jgi:hypothetical protein